MKSNKASVLTINGGSSSIKFALYEVGEPLKRGLQGKVDRIGLSGTNLTFTDPDGKPQPSLALTAPDPSLRPGTRAPRDRVDRSVSPASSETPAVGLLRHGVSPRHAARGQAA